MVPEQGERERKPVQVTGLAKEIDFLVQEPRLVLFGGGEALFVTVGGV